MRRKGCVSKRQESKPKAPPLDPKEVATPAPAAQVIEQAQARGEQWKLEVLAGSMVNDWHLPKEQFLRLMKEREGR
jgi:hypothetical protein